MEIPKQLQNENFRFCKIINGTKAPEEKCWQSWNNYLYDSIKFKENKDAYGVVCGIGNLYVVDFDNKEIQEKLMKNLPPTFSVKTGGKGLLHLYFTDKSKLPLSYQIDRDGKRIVDIQGTGKQVIGPNSKHAETGNLYEVVNNVPIAEFPQEELLKLLGELNLKYNLYGGSGSGHNATLRLCKFHDDHEPSMAIYQDNGTFYCFGCRGYGFIEVLNYDNPRQKETKNGTFYYINDNDFNKFLDSFEEQEQLQPQEFLKENPQDKGIVVNEEKINLQYKTSHLPYFNELKNISQLHGNIYIPFLKGFYYNLCSLFLRDNIGTIEINDLRTDVRISLSAVIGSGQGKKNLKNMCIKIIEGVDFNYHVPTTFHPEQLIGKVLKRGTPLKPIWVRSEGYLSRDYLIFDEAYQLLTSRDPQIQESRKNLRISKDVYGENKVEKKSVDNKFDEKEMISYYPKVIIVCFILPKSLPPEIVEEGDIRRDLILYRRGLSERDKQEDYKNRLKNKVDTKSNIKIFKNFLLNLQKNSIGKKIEFTEEAIDRLIELHNLIISQGFVRSEREANFCNMVDFTLEDFFVKLAVIISRIYNEDKVSVNSIELAFMDLMEFFSMQLDFIKDKIKGKLDYGEGWCGAIDKDQECLEWLYNEDSTNEENSKIMVKEFKKKIAEIKGVTYYDDPQGGEGGMAPKHYQRFKKNGWIESKQEGQYESKVWLTFKPSYIGSKLIIKGSKGSKGITAYNTIISKLEPIKDTPMALPPLLPLLPSKTTQTKITNEETPEPKVIEEISKVESLEELEDRYNE
jgi:hypothetical protein